MPPLVVRWIGVHAKQTAGTKRAEMAGKPTCCRDNVAEGRVFYVCDTLPHHACAGAWAVLRVWRRRLDRYGQRPDKAWILSFVGCRLRSPKRTRNRLRQRLTGVPCAAHFSGVVPHQVLLHVSGEGPWSDVAVLAWVPQMILPSLAGAGAIEVWIIEDRAFPKKEMVACQALSIPANA